MAKQKNKSFRKRLRTANISVFICTLLFLIVFNVMNVSFLSRYNKILQAYNITLAYYDQTEKIMVHIKDYLYTENEDAMKQFEQASHYAKDLLAQLKEIDYIEESWRFDLLINMNRRYDALCRKIASEYHDDSRDYVNSYTKLQRYFYLINDTSNDYFRMITKAMQSQKNTLTTVKVMIEVASMMLALILFIWVFYYIHRIMNSLTRPIEQLLVNIQDIKDGKYDLRSISSSGIEMQQLCDALGDMASQIQVNLNSEREKAMLKNRLLAQENDNLKKDEMLIQSELRMLQNQVNPHFLFNTLNLINRLVLENELQVASAMIIKTSQLLRYGLDMQNKISSIQHEVDAINSYIEIQGFRVGERIQFNVNFQNQEELAAVRIPGMILQPLVENSIKHGLHDVLEHGLVEILIRKETNHILISVCDNGCGVEKTILHELMKVNFKQRDHLGLYNVLRRMEMFYKEQLTIQIQSDINCGFQIHFIITCDDMITNKKGNVWE